LLDFLVRNICHVFKVESTPKLVGESCCVPPALADQLYVDQIIPSAGLQRIWEKANKDFAQNFCWHSSERGEHSTVYTELFLKLRQPLVQLRYLGGYAVDLELEKGGFMAIRSCIGAQEAMQSGVVTPFGVHGNDRNG
jgi:hypothetical protein